MTLITSCVKFNVNAGSMLRPNVFTLRKILSNWMISTVPSRFVTFISSMVVGIYSFTEGYSLYIKKIPPLCNGPFNEI